MSDFDALLKRSFAEAHEPADDGFSIQVSHAVARNERVARIRNAAQSGAWAVAAAAILFGLYGLAMNIAPDVLTSLGFGISRAHDVISGPGANAMQTLSAGMTQILLVVGAIAGGLVAYRATQE
ncbi:MAG: hypothetical protein JSS00_02235 [Proteobacteria bacterium]|nr:hypothetical protein [Pseudomonadota bacterium]